MDKLRDVTVFLSKYGFWLGCGGIALLVLGLWYYTTGEIIEQTEANRAAINGKVSVANQVINKKPHPNQITDEAMGKLNQSHAIDLAQGWQSVYDRQKDVLVWPTSLGKDFEQAVRNKRPIETVSYPTLEKDDIGARFRQRYRDWIRLEIPKLADKIKAEWSFKEGENNAGQVMQQAGPRGIGPGGRGGPGAHDPNAAIEVSPYLVDWASANQAEIMQEHFGFTQAVETPSTLDVLYAQETLWVLTTLVGIIAEVNGDAEARYQTSIRTIESIQVGRSAGGVGGTVMPVALAAVAVDPNAPPPAEGEGNYLPAPAAMPPGTERSGGGVGASVDPAAGRYVDQNFLPLDAARLRDALTNPAGKPEDVVLAVAKRMPVRLRLRIDQRKTNQLLAACGNSKLPLEVRQIRVNRSAVTAGGGGGGPGPGAMPMRGNGGLSGEMPTFSDRGPGGAAMPSATLGQDSNEITIEVFGIVYIYNPVNYPLLGITPEMMKARPAAVAPVNETTMVAPAATR